MDGVDGFLPSTQSSRRFCGVTFVSLRVRSQGWASDHPYSCGLKEGNSHCLLDLFPCESRLQNILHLEKKGC